MPSKLISNYCEFQGLIFPGNLKDIYDLWCKLILKIDYIDLQKLILYQINSEKTGHLEKLVTIYSNQENVKLLINCDVKWTSELEGDSDELKQNMLCFIKCLNNKSYHSLSYVFNIITLSKNRQKSGIRFVNWQPTQIKNRQKLLGKCQKGEYAIWEYLLLHCDNNLLINLEILFLFYYKLNDKKIYLICAVVLFLLYNNNPINKLIDNKLIDNKLINISPFLDKCTRMEYLNTKLPQIENPIELIDKLTDKNHLERYYKIKKPGKKKQITLTNENELIMDPIPN